MANTGVKKAKRKIKSGTDVKPASTPVSSVSSISSASTSSSNNKGIVTNVQTQYIVKDSQFVLNIPQGVERKIRYHMVRYPNREWSGYLFYDVTGSFEENNLVFEAKDFIVLDIGDGSTTSITENPRVFNLMFKRDLLDYKQGLIHSHHSMKAFFSGTDDAALKQEAMTMPHYLSLVVNKAGEYVARVTKKENVVQKIDATVTEHKNYPTYNGVTVEMEAGVPKKVTTQRESITILAYNLIINVEKYDDSIPKEWEEDLNEASKSGYRLPAQSDSYAASEKNAVTGNTFFKQAQATIDWDDPYDTYDVKSFENYHKSNYPTEKPSSVQPKDTVSDIPDMPDVPDNEMAEEISYETMTQWYTHDEIKLLTLQIISGNVFIPKSKITQLKQYAVMLTGQVKETFDTIEAYMEFAEPYIEALLASFVSSHCVYYSVCDEFCGIVAAECSDVLNEFGLTNNKIITGLQSILYGHIIY